MSDSYQILIIDDEPNLRRSLALILRKAGYQTEEAASGREALALLSEQQPHLVFLDLQMPGMSGVELLRAVRRQWPQLPVLILTAHASLDSAIEAVRQGARDYLIKPVDPPQIVARVGEILAEQQQPQRQREIVGEIQQLLAELKEVSGDLPANPLAAIPPTDSDRFLAAGPFTLDLHARHATRDGQYLELTPSAFDYLATLIRHAPEPVPYQKLVREAQGYTCTTNEAREMSRWHIHQLRKLVEPDSGNPQYVITMRGVGYRFAA